MKLRYYFALALLCLPTFANAQQIPNGSFEVWEGGNPTGWITTNFPPLALPITQSNTAVDGQSSLRGEVLDLGGFGVPALAGTGRMLTAETFELGFPYTPRPAALNGYVAADIAGQDTVNIIAVFRSGGDSIGVAFHRLGHDQANLTSFSAPVFWLDNRTPDTAYVMILVDGEPTPTAGSNFLVDGLTFGPAASVGRETLNSSLTATQIIGGYEFAINNSQFESARLEVLDIHGRVIETLVDEPVSETRIRWFGQNLANGVYFARLSTPSGVTYEKLAITR